jgi:hypothetical protein
MLVGNSSLARMRKVVANMAIVGGLACLKWNLKWVRRYGVGSF